MTVAELEARMTGREFIEQLAYIKWEREGPAAPGPPMAPAVPEWQRQMNTLRFLSEIHNAKEGHGRP